MKKRYEFDWGDHFQVDGYVTAETEQEAIDKAVEMIKDQLAAVDWIEEGLDIEVTEEY